MRNTLVGATQNAETITSLQIAEVTGKQHAHIMRDIRNLLEQVGEEGASIFGLSSYKSEQNKDLPMYYLTKKACLLLASGYDAKLRLAIINRWEELETAHQPKVPTTFREALLLAAEQQEVIEKQQLQLTEQAPKVDFYESVTGSNDTIDMASVAKVLNMGVGRNKLFDILRNERVLMQTNAPYAKYIDMGWFRQVESKYNKPNGDTCINIKTVVFQKGVEGIRKILKRTKKETI